MGFIVEGLRFRGFWFRGVEFRFLGFMGSWRKTMQPAQYQGSPILERSSSNQSPQNPLPKLVSESWHPTTIQQTDRFTKSQTT